MTSTSALLSPQEAFDQCASFYDQEINPVVALNDRILQELLPDASGKTVVDLGCGTGRTLSLWSKFQPARLIGIDISIDMLRVAQNRHPNLIQANGCSLPLASSTADFATSCLVLGYLPDVAAFAQELARVIKPDGLAFVSELHPATVKQFGWKRTFGYHNGTVTLESTHIPLATILQIFSDAGLTADIVLETPFGAPERKIFETAGRLDKFELFGGVPAVYILQFRCTQGPHLHASSHLRFRNARVALGENSTSVVDLYLGNDRLTKLGASHTYQKAETEIDLSGYLLLPGLVNAHDHLEFALFPRLGRGGYANSREWANDIYRPAELPIREHLRVPKWVRLWWGGIRNLLAGVTTVCHHNPYDPAIFDSDFPVRVVREFNWAHSLEFEPAVNAKFRRTSPGSPFVIHLAEGIDQASEIELDELDKFGALDHRTVVVHGLALRDAGLRRLNDRGGGLIWCPSSNRFLFNQTLCPRQVASMSRSALGTDSPLTGIGDFLDELRFARRLGASSPQLYQLATSGAQRTLMLRCGEGQLLPGNIADIVAVADRGNNPADRLTSLSYSDVELVIVGGKIKLASDELLPRLPSDVISNLEPLWIDHTRRWVLAPVDELLRITRDALGPRITMHGRVLSQ